MLFLKVFIIMLKYLFDLIANKPLIHPISKFTETIFDYLLSAFQNYIFIIIGQVILIILMIFIFNNTSQYLFHYVILNHFFCEMTTTFFSYLLYSCFQTFEKFLSLLLSFILVIT